MSEGKTYLRLGTPVGVGPAVLFERPKRALSCEARPWGLRKLINETEGWLSLTNTWLAEAVGKPVLLPVLLDPPWIGPLWKGYGLMFLSSKPQV